MASTSWRGGFGLDGGWSSAVTESYGRPSRLPRKHLGLTVSGMSERLTNAARMPRTLRRETLRGICHAEFTVILAVVFVLGGCSSTGVEPSETASDPSNKIHATEAVARAEQAFSQGYYDAARRLVDRVLLNDPDHAKALLLVAELYLANGLLDRALVDFGALVERPEVAAMANQGKGLALLGFWRAGSLS